MYLSEILLFFYPSLEIRLTVGKQVVCGSTNFNGAGEALNGASFRVGITGTEFNFGS